MKSKVRVGGVFEFTCTDAGGRLKWRERADNLVVSAGLNDMLNKYFKGAAYTAAHFIGLKGSGALAAGDTTASHAGWAEIAAYAEPTRPSFTPGAVAAQSVSNSPAVFSINAIATVAGAFLVTDSTKSGTTGILFSGVDFASPRGVANGDTLNVTYTFSAADDGV